ncbi:MAG: serine protease [Terriglobia bacterium]|nr:serine protease [Terriglobia bacterium]
MQLRAVTFLASMVLASTAVLEAQVTSNVFERVIEVRVNAGTINEETATAFTLDVDGREYLITAKHVVTGLRQSDRLEILAKGRWQPLMVRIFRCEDPIDIAVLIPPRQLTVDYSLPFDNQNYQIGQDAFFLGFPYGIDAPANGLNGAYPFALVKRAAISGQIAIDPAKQEGKIFLDGYNNPGFSGGPIVYRDFSQGGYVLKLAGVVSGFLPEVVPVMKEHDIDSPASANEESRLQPWRIRRRQDGGYFEFVDNGTFVPLNTGIIVGYSIAPAIVLIRQHPLGPKVGKLPTNDPFGVN